MAWEMYLSSRSSFSIGLRGDVLAAGGDDDLFFSINDIDKSLLIDPGNIAGLEPTVLKGLIGRLLVV